MKIVCCAKQLLQVVDFPWIVSIILFVADIPTKKIENKYEKSRVRMFIKNLNNKFVDMQMDYLV